jgi:hypothetical protein
VIGLLNSFEERRIYFSKNFYKVCGWNNACTKRKISGVVQQKVL